MTRAGFASLSRSGAATREGVCHIRILEVLEERGYDVVSLADSSMGALVGGLYAAPVAWRPPQTGCAP